MLSPCLDGSRSTAAPDPVCREGVRPSDLSPGL